MRSKPEDLRFDHLKYTEAEDEEDLLRCRVGADQRERRKQEQPNEILRPKPAAQG
jgi:hypothetical protein